MKLKNLMENKQLDFNQPFLSVRRVLSMETSLKANETVITENRWPPLPVYKSELKSGPVSNPGNVPFLWEHAPGRPKDGRKSLTIGSKSPLAAPKHPSGMSSGSEQQHCNSKESTSGGEALRNSDHSPAHKNIVKFKTLRERIERDLSSDSEDGDETYLDAKGTISRSESFSMNCSVTGLSGLDGGDVKPSGSFSKDQRTHDIMMGRFLPAAKAMASETPQVAHRKQSVQREHRKEAKKLIRMGKEHRVNSLPPVLPSYYVPPNPHDVEEISEDDDISLDESEYSSTKSCGLFARFCLLHPVPGMRTQSASVASAPRVQNDYLTDGSCSSIKNLRNEEKPLDANQMVESTPNDSRRRYKSHLSEEKVFPSDPVGVKSSIHRRAGTKFRELLANESSSVSPFVIEKTSLVDSVHNMKSRSSNSSSKENLHLDSSPQHVQPLNVEGENKRLSSTSIDSMDLCSSYYDMKANLKATRLDVDLIHDAKVTDERTIDSECDHHKKSSQGESSDDSFQDFVSFTSSEASKLRLEGHDQDSITSTSSRATARGKIDLESTRRSKRSLSISSQLALAPPLPKSPSESWLKRTLPTVSSRNSMPKSRLDARVYSTRQTNTVF
ncbi:hypothetical protein SDJN02_27179 [Cucurbita argyrosperma subsp. argyrosperma]|nr:hypothetical protein SDJN02_27179 [Cucurbita argyrosperma subsp. argyrosperma]